MYFPETLQEFPNFGQLKSFAGSPFTKLYDICMSSNSLLLGLTGAALYHDSLIREQIRVNEAHSLRAVLPEMFQPSTSDYSNFVSERYAASASVTRQLEGNILPVVALNFDLPTPVWSGALTKPTLDGHARSSSLNFGSNDKTTNTPPQELDGKQKELFLRAKISEL